ncbi:MAG: PEP-CTERM sorting domain-containing protein, partial [Phormidesmis sp. CAN_BIN36]|nr:PEP-CTERM sorting domain-containing protein [Phormidesmis sp. CAN_BIN36]
SQADSLVPTDVLTGLFFNLSGATLNPLAASLGAGSQVYGATSPIGNVGGEWASASNLAIGSNTYNYGVSAAGLGLFGPKNRFDTSSNLSGTENVGGLDFGIVTAGDNPNTGNGGLNRDLIKGSVLFTFGLTNVASNFDLTKAISNLRFQYGTATSEPSFAGSLALSPTPPVKRVPEPSMIAALLLTGFATLRARKQQSKQ